uniref:Ribosomal protein L2 n=1 Tax=Balanophora laxiflora TaxID=1128103 RepID=A0A3S5XHJ8_9MAGN
MIFYKKNKSNNNFNIKKWFYKKGKNSSGIIILKYRNIGHKNLYRKIIININNKFIFGKIITIEYDPNRNSYICFINIYYYNCNNIYKKIKNKKKFIIYIYGLKIGNIIKFNNNNIKIGNIILLKNIPLGTIISNIKIIKNFNKKFKILVKSAGCFSKILFKNNNSISIKLPSKKIFQISNKYYANIGQIGNLKFKNKKFLKAGCKCWIGKKSIVRGSAMNPVDHPHGGGKGKSSIGKKKPSTFWGYKKK